MKSLPLRDLVEKPKNACSGGCSRCGVAEGRDQDDGGLRGWRLTLSAGAAFVLPLVVAAAGARLAGPAQTPQFLGALGGLIVGLVCGVGIARLVRRSTKGAA